MTWQHPADDKLARRGVNWGALGAVSFAVLAWSVVVLIVALAVNR